MRQSILATLVAFSFIVSSFPSPTPTTVTPSRNPPQPTTRNAQCAVQAGADSQFNRGASPIPKLGDKGAYPTSRSIGAQQRVAQAQQASSITQITNSIGGNNSTPAINADATRIAFVSNRDLTGGNADGKQEIFLFDTTTRTFTQITSSTEGFKFSPSIGANGTRIAFVSATPVDFFVRFNISLFDTTTNTLTQITTDGGSREPSINATGTRIAFESTGNLTGENPALFQQIFLFDTTTNTFTQITHATAGSNSTPRINTNGTRIAFISDNNLTGANLDDNQEIFLFDTTTNAFTQITNSTGGGLLALSINANGTRIAFASSRDLTGGNADGNQEIFLFDTTTTALTQITNSTGGMGGEFDVSNFDPSINADGTRIAFVSNRDLVTGNNADGNREIFLFDTSTNTFTQITNSTSGTNASPSINADGTQIAFASTSDLVTGGNADGNQEIFLARPAGVPPRPVVTTFGPPSPANPSGTTAEPVNTATGNYFFQRTDLTLPSRGLPVIFTRTYNSEDTYVGPLGHGWTHSYNIFLTENTDGTVVIKQGDGHAEFYDPSGDGKNYQSRFAGVFNVLVKNPDATFTLTTKDQIQYQFSTSGKLTRITDRNGNAMGFSYDTDDHLITITDTVGRTITLRYDADGRIIELTDPIGQVVRYSYDAAGNLNSVTDPNGGIMRYSYDGEHRVTRITDQRGNTLLENSYDANGRVVSQTNGRNFVTTFAYGVPQVGDTSITDPLGNTTIHTHDTQFRLIQVTDPLGNHVPIQYDVDNNRTALIDKNGNVTRFTYDTRGNVTSITDPLSNTIAFTYDATNNVTSNTDARGFTTSFDYDAKGNLIRIHDAVGNITTLAYDAFGQVRKTTDARGNVTRYAYDDQGNLQSITDAKGGITRSAYDGLGRLVRFTNPNGHTIAVSYDANSQLLQVVDSLGHASDFAYDPVGNLVEITDARNNKTRYDYDEVNNLTAVTDALGHITRYTYDANNNLTSLTDANGHKTLYSVDALSRLTTITDPLGNTTTYSYDAAGNVIAVSDANGTKNTFTYNGNNILTEIVYGDGHSVAYCYDANDNPISMTDQRGTTTYTYDALDQLTQVTHPDSSVVSYGYDAIGNQTRLIYPDGRAVAYDYDPLNRLARVTDWEGEKTRYSYDAASNLRQITFPNDTSISYRYDAADRLTEVTNKRNGVTLARFGYTLDELGNRIGVEERGQAVRDRTSFYLYDALSQLMVAAEQRSAEPIKFTAYNYDSVGNRLTSTEFLSTDNRNTMSLDSISTQLGLPEVLSRAQLNAISSNTIHYTYDAADRLLQAGDTSFTYDANGNRRTEATTGTHSIEYNYDAANRLIQVTRDNTKVAYTYDGDGNKVEQTITGVEEAGGSGTTEAFRFLNDLASPLPVVLTQDHVQGGKQKDSTHYLYGGLVLVSEELTRAGPHSRPETFFYHSDGLGSTVALTSRSGSTKAQYQYDAWGNLERSRGDVPNRFLFTGEEQDPETSLYYLRARWYDPKVGRFLTKDPFAGFSELPLSINGYVYALNNPTNLIDPSGFSFLKKIGHAIAKASQSVGNSIVGKIAKNPVVAFGVRLGLTAAGCALGAVTVVGAAVGCAVGAGAAELSLSFLRGEIGCVPTGYILGRAALAATLAGVTGAINPSLFKSLTTGLTTPEIYPETTSLGLTFGEELYLGGVTRGMGAAAKAITAPKGCPNGKESPEPDILLRGSPLQLSSIGTTRRAK